MAKRSKKPAHDAPLLGESAETAATEESGYRPLPTHLQKLIDLLPLNEPVHRDVIFKAYGNSNYARRIRKIQSEYGWLIERVRGKKGANDDYYIRRSDGPVQPQRIRYEVSPKRRQVIYNRDKWKCQICGAPVGKGQDLTMPQCDHKIPSERGGPSTDENQQTLCLVCNLKKRQACKHCKLTSCLECPFAFPEKFDTLLTIRMSKDAADTLQAESARQGVPPSTIIAQLLDGLSTLRASDAP